jgi:sporulation protein YlmC with PRC-barrel domain
MLKIKKISGALGKKAFTDAGDIFGEVEECLLSENKVDSWRIRVSREMAGNLNGARGVIIPHQFVKAVGDILLINKASLPISSTESISTEESMDLTQGSNM